MIDTNLHILLAKKRMSQKELADATGINKNAINRYYNNNFEKIDRKHLDILCDFFNCTPNELFSYTPNLPTLIEMIDNIENKSK